MLFESDVRIVIDGGRRGEQNHPRLRPTLRLRAADQLFANAEPLVALAYREIGKIGRIREVGQRSRDADEQIAGPGGDDEISVGEHRAHALAVVHWAPRTQAAGTVTFD